MVSNKNGSLLNNLFYFDEDTLSIDFPSSFNLITTPPCSTAVFLPAFIKKAGIPAVEFLTFYAKLPWGVILNEILPFKYSF